MTAVSHRGARALLLMLPSLTLATGVALAGASTGTNLIPNRDVLIVMCLAALAPPTAAVVLWVIAPGCDLLLVAVAGMFVAIGTSALSVLSMAPGSDGAFYTAIVIRHGTFVGAGFFAMIVGAFAARGIDRASRYPFTLLGTALLLTIVTVIFGETVNGARLWLQIGPARFQPSEIARLLIAVFVAVFLYERRHLVAAPWRVGSIDLPPAPYLLPLAAAVLGAAAVLVFQNDLGMAALVVLGACASVAGVLSSKTSLGLVALLLGAAVVGSFLTVSRVRDRVVGWLDPWLDPAGRGFQFVQAEYSLAAGGFAGNGATIAVESVPEVHTDFMLVGVGSQFGWLVALALLALTGLLVCRCVLAALHTRNGFKALLALSFSALIGIQVILIVGGSLRVLPLTGLTFPLVSYGGTSMIVTLFALGVITGIGADWSRTP